MGVDGLGTGSMLWRRFFCQIKYAARPKAMTPNGIPTPSPTFRAEFECGLDVADTDGVGPPVDSAGFADANVDVPAKGRLLLDVDTAVDWVVEVGRVSEVLVLVVETMDDVGLEEAVVDVTPMVVRILGVPSKRSVLTPASQSQPELSIQQ